MVHQHLFVWRRLTAACLVVIAGCGQSTTEPSGVQRDAGIVVGVYDAVLFADTNAPLPDVIDAGSDGSTNTADARNTTADGDASAKADLISTDTSACLSGCDDGLPCTIDTCTAGVCAHKIAPGNCISAGVCVPAGVSANSPCVSCKPEVSVLSLQPVASASCDDGVACTKDDRCDDAGSCIGTPSAGCCTSDENCATGAPCLTATCDTTTGKCQTAAKVGCCTQGVCCDPATFSARLAGAACGTATVKQRWACHGDAMRAQQGRDGCDGVKTTACSTNASDLNWSTWSTVATCGAGTTCVLIDSATKPTCGVKPQCTGDAQCNDGKICTTDTCVNGACAHPPGNAGVPCGTKAVATQYKCGAQNGGFLKAVFIRHAVTTCDGVSATCSTSTQAKAWGAWQVLKTCGFNETCKLISDAVAAKCVGAPKCQPSSTCCTTAGDYAAKGTACGTKTVATEAKCDGTKGGKLNVREASGGCAGGSTSCYTYVASYRVWGTWKTTKQCGPLETCTVNYSGTSGSCSKKTQCSSTSQCCDSDGFFRPKGHKCGTKASKTEQRCKKPAGANQGPSIEERQGWGSCNGTSQWCNSGTAALIWQPWQTKTSCAKTGSCTEQWGVVKCETACTPNQSCCSPLGELRAVGTTCGGWTVKTERKCSDAKKGAKQMIRKATYGCSGKTASCSYLDINVVWAAWTVEKPCKAWQRCAVKFNSPTCTSTCDPSDACCTTAGDFTAKGTACSTYPSKTETKCSGVEKGAKIMIRTAVRGCSGTSSTCSYGVAEYVWGAWKVKSACGVDKYCRDTFSVYCSSTPPPQP